MSIGQHPKRETIVDDFVRKVKAALEEKGWNVTTLAEKAGVAYPYLYRVLSGQHKPSIENAAKIGRPLGLKIEIVETRKKVAV